MAVSRDLWEDRHHSRARRYSGEEMLVRSGVSCCWFNIAHSRSYLSSSSSPPPWSSLLAWSLLRAWFSPPIAGWNSPVWLQFSGIREKFAITAALLEGLGYLFQQSFLVLSFCISMRGDHGRCDARHDGRHELLPAFIVDNPRPSKGEVECARGANVFAPCFISWLPGDVAVQWTSSMHHCVDKGNCGLPLPDLPSQWL